MSHITARGCSLTEDTFKTCREIIKDIESDIPLDKYYCNDAY
jgi:hypothetical protein